MREKYGQTDDDKMQKSQYQYDVCRYDSWFRTLSKHSFAADIFLFQEIVDESFFMQVKA